MAEAKDGKDPKETERLRVGAAVRRRRRSLDLTLAAVAERSGLSVPFLSQVENERARPSMGSLQRVADALETTTERLIEASDAARTVTLTRAVTAEAADAAVGTNTSGVTAARIPATRRLVRGRHQLEALEFLGEHATEGEFQHRNDELMYVADGAVEVEAEGRAHRLGPGDALFLSGGVMHRWRTTGPDARMIVVTVAEHIETPGEG
ncbi:XRE family transcriptional regulator [Streptomyces sp. CAU 1734]|uniref:helix-turn-helix domain-containing protein n=1 Tax=Streptomyces sp. CAU 1734 TaxID=3140360 RepID=UPI003260ED47